MRLTFSNQKLKEILFLQDFGQNPDKFKFLNVNGHIGIDINIGDKDPVFSFCDGEVCYTSKYGDVVIKDDAFEYTYSHMIGIQVWVGQKVNAGTLLGYQDSNGKSIEKENWSHLHFGVRELGEETPKIWNFGNKIKNVNNGFDGYISQNNLFKPVFYRIAKAIEIYENMDKSYNNPGALRYSPFQSGTRNNFSVFNSYNDGWEALLYQLKLSCSGKSRFYNQNGNCFDFFNVYAPIYDNNNSTKYAEFVAKFVGISGKEPIKDWLLTELDWIRKYNGVNKTFWVSDNLILFFNELWGKIFKN